MARRTHGPSRTIIVLVLTGIGGVLLLIAANRFEQPWLIGPGLILFAIGIIAAGVQAIVSRYVLERDAVRPTFLTFHGAAAILIGVSLIVLGLAFGVAGVAFVLGTQDALYALLLSRPGIALLPAGVATTAGGGARVAGARQWRGSAGRILASIPERIGGVMLAVLGLTLVAAGVFELAMPEEFDRVVERLLP